MADSSDDGIPAWQRASEQSSATSSSAEATPAASTDTGSDAGSEASSAAAEDKLTIARRFLDDENVKNEPRDKKVAFLKSKGVEDDNIQKLLGDAPTVRLRSLHNHIQRLLTCHSLADYR